MSLVRRAADSVGFTAVIQLQRDGLFLLGCRAVRLFSFGLTSVILVLYLSELGFDTHQIGMLLSLTLGGDAIISLLITTSADKYGRKSMLLIGAVLKCGAGVVFATSSNFYILTAAATLGVISPSGNEVGPFLAIEQAAISQLIPAEDRTGVLAWYNLIGSSATALGAFMSGAVVSWLQTRAHAPLSALAAYRIVLFAYSALAFVLFLLNLCTSRHIEVSPPAQEGARHGQSRLGLTKSTRTVMKLSALFALDAFAGALIVQSIVAYWFRLKFGTPEIYIGSVLALCNIVAAISALLAVVVAKRIGLIMTMVVTHLPSNVLVLLVPLMPSQLLAMAVLVARFSISQMDVPTRQSYVVAVVDPSERTAAGGITNIARSVGSFMAPWITGLLIASPHLLSVPFFICGALKIVYDLVLLYSFHAIRPPEEESKPLLSAQGSTAPLAIAVAPAAPSPTPASAAVSQTHSGVTTSPS